MKIIILDKNHMTNVNYSFFFIMNIYFKTNLMNVRQVGEVGELSEIFQWKGEVERGLPNWSNDDKKHLEEEISDVLLYLVQLADVCGLDLGQAALSKILKNAQKYPLIK